MTIRLKNIGKRYGKHWVVKGVNFEFKSGVVYGLTGANGAGKSTLLKIISSVLTPTKGSLSFFLNGQSLEPQQAAMHISFSAPYIDLIPEMTLQETLNFHFTFKESLVEPERITKLVVLDGQEKKQIRELSSGMQQRLKVGIALLTKSAVILLDEPTSNLDEQGVAWFHDLMNNYSQKRLVIIASNIAEDYKAASEILSVETFKTDIHD